MTHTPQKCLQNWFLEQKRSFPWRENPTPYAVWISEIMLQQTRAGVVVGYFRRWMNQFPTLDAVAEAPIEELIKAWEGLGYYSRVRNIKKAAVFLKSQRKDLPSSILELREIPGIGPYTAGAIASFAFHQKAAAVDGNVTRVISRYFGLEDVVSRSFLEEKTLSFLSDETPWIQMEALIELGATVCSKTPSCSSCPLNSSCLAYKMNKTATIPPPKKYAPAIYQHKQVAIILWEDLVMIEKREEGKVLGGLMEFPSFEYSIEEDIQKKILDCFSLETEWIEDLPKQKQSFTKYQVDLSPSIFRANCKKEGFEWKTKEELLSYPFSSGHKRILESFLNLDRS